VALEHAVEVVSGLSARDHEVFADDLEKIHARALLQDPPVVRNAKAHADTEIGSTEASEHARTILPGDHVAVFERPRRLRRPASAARCAPCRTEDLRLRAPAPS